MLKRLLKAIAVVVVALLLGGITLGVTFTQEVYTSLNHEHEDDLIIVPSPSPTPVKTAPFPSPSPQPEGDEKVIIVPVLVRMEPAQPETVRVLSLTNSAARAGTNRPRVLRNVGRTRDLRHRLAQMAGINGLGGKDDGFLTQEESALNRANNFFELIKERETSIKANDENSVRHLLAKVRKARAEAHLNIVTGVPVEPMEILRLKKEAHDSIAALYQDCYKKGIISRDRWEKARLEKAESESNLEQALAIKRELDSLQPPEQSDLPNDLGPSGSEDDEEGDDQWSTLSVDNSRLRLTQGTSLIVNSRHFAIVVQADDYTALLALWGKASIGSEVTILRREPVEKVHWEALPSMNKLSEEERVAFKESFETIEHLLNK